jgi:hypothetical protein
MNATRTLAAAICTLFLGTGVLAGGSSGNPPAAVQPSHKSEAPVMVQQPPKAADVAKQLNGTNFTAKDVGNGKVLWGMTSGGTFMLKGTKYAVNTFTTSQARDAWLKTVKRFGVNPKWLTSTAVVYPSVMPGG